METLYKVFPRSVLHGGIAIWRCYSGNRFSEDVNTYVEKDLEKINKFFEELKRAGFEVTKKKDNEKFDLFLSEFRGGRSEVRSPVQTR